METKRRFLLEHAVQELGQCHPKSVLDVGCGTGLVLEACRDAGWPACGVEPAPGTLTAARDAGLTVVAGDAAHLPFPSGSVDWVVMRHVPHHLAEPVAAMAEAWRVAHTGIFLVEPWFDESDPGQRAALSIDRFLKSLDRRRGKFHADVLGADELLALLPETPASSEISTLAPKPPYDATKFETEFTESAEGLELTAAEVREADEHRSRVAEGDVTEAGTMVLTVKK